MFEKVAATLLVLTPFRNTFDNPPTNGASAATGGSANAGGTTARIPG